MAKHIITGTAAPADAPTELGQHYVDTATPAIYFSVGTATAADWKLVQEAGLLGTIAIQDANNVAITGGSITNLTTLELPVSATPAVATDGEIALDTTVADFSHGVIKFYGTEEQGVVSMPIAQFTAPTDGYVVTYNATDDEFVLAAGGGSVSTVNGISPTMGDVSLNGGYIGVKGADIASAATVDLATATGDWVDVTGTTTITALGTLTAGIERLVRFTGILTLTHNGTSLILPTGANITTAAGDFARFRSLGSGNWVCVAYQRASGAALAGGGGSVSGPVSSTDNAAALWDGTGGDTLKNSTLVVGASDATIGGNAIYRAGGTDVPVADGGTGGSSFTAYAVICGGTTSTNPLQSIAGVGTSGQVLTSNGAGALPTFQTAAGGSLTNWTEAVSTASPNDTIAASSFTATNAAASVDAVIAPKGSAGALLAQIPDGTTTGGNKRGSKALDFQMSRAAANQVASGGQAVIVGGVNNRASGNTSFIGGGTGNLASTTNATVCGGQANTASGGNSVVAGGGGSGVGNTASGTAAGVLCGTSNSASGNEAAVIGGAGCTSSGAYSTTAGVSCAASQSGAVAMGNNCTADAINSFALGERAATNSIAGASARASGRFAANGDAQRKELILRSDTTTATPEAVTTNNSAAAATNQAVLQNNSLIAFEGQLVVRENATGDSKAIEFKGCIKRGANAASTALLGSVTQADLGTPDAGSAGWTVGFTADTTNGALAITVTGEASHTLRWVARVVTTEVVG